MNLSSSLEDYLETILELEKENGKVRVTDIGKALNVEKSSVNFAVNKLKNLRLLNHEPYEGIELTAKGRKEAERILRKHNMLICFLHDFLGIEKLQAETDACKLEHALSCHSFERLVEFMNFSLNDECFKLEDWKKAFDAYRESSNTKKDKCK